MTESITARSGSGRSRLHRTDNGEFLAYAVWPSRQQWEGAGTLPSSNADAGATMRACIERSIGTTMLDVVDDLLLPLP